MDRYEQPRNSRGDSLVRRAGDLAGLVIAWAPWVLVAIFDVVMVWGALTFPPGQAAVTLLIAGGLTGMWVYSAEDRPWDP